MKINRLIVKGLMLGAVLAAPVSASADPLYDFSTGATGLLGSQVVLGPVTASAYYWDGDSWETSFLWRRDEPGDNGLGVCSEGAGSCASLGGDVNELSQLTNTEAIVLTLADGFQYSDVWLSSLDNSLPGGVENGRMFWGNDLNTVLAGAAAFQAFTYPAFGGSLVEGQLALTSPAGVAASRLLAFVPGNGISTLGANEDYLVWGVGATSVPDGGSAVALLGLGLLGLSTLRRKFGSR